MKKLNSDKITTILGFLVGSATIASQSGLLNHETAQLIGSGAGFALMAWGYFTNKRPPSSTV